MSSSRTEREGTSAATVEVVMPQMGVSVAEGTIIEWRKRPGDWVEADETLAEVSTDKVDVEIPAPVAGRLSEILVQPDETVPVGTPLAKIDAGARPGEAHPEEHRGEPEAGGAPIEQAPPAEKAGPGDGNGKHPGGEERDRSGLYSPVVRRVAEEHGVDLSQVEGHGVGGRVRKKDLLAFLERRDEDGRTEPALHTESPYRPEPEPAAAERSPAESPQPGPVAPVSGGRREALSSMRQAIARHMLASRRTSAHCTTVVEVDFSRVAARRRELRETMERRGVSLTYLAFVARATIEALERHPRLNASLDEDEIVLHDDVNLGIAVALEDGLIVPVIRQAQRLSLEGLAGAISDAAERARARRLTPDEMEGGTFTITNPGQFGAVLATPIIHQPQVAILDLEAIVKRPVVVDGPDGDAIAIRPMSYLCMSWDHRALDGADAARFLSELKRRLESWEAGE